MREGGEKAMPSKGALFRTSQFYALFLSVKILPLVRIKMLSLNLS